MTAKKQTKPAAEAGTLVYCGPTIPGVAKQFTSYQGGIPEALAAAQKQTPGAWRPDRTAEPAPGGHAPAAGENRPHLCPVPKGTETKLTGGKATWQPISMACTTRNRPRA